MEGMLERCAGLDIHQATIVATVRGPDAAGGRQSLTHTFGTMTTDLLALREWLQAYGVTHVAMESTGVYWKPLYYLLEEHVTVLLVNMQHLKQVPGRKSDVKDSEWLAQLLECGLLRGSLVPPAPIRDLRDLTRYRKKQIEDRTQEVNRLYRVLEEAGVKLASVMTDIMGRSGRAMLDALLAGTTDPTVLAELARGRLRPKIPALREALRGQFRSHHAFLVGQILAKIDFLEEAITQLSEEIDRQLLPFVATVERLQTIPGWGRRTATTVFVETGGDMARFRSAAQLCSWGAMCPAWTNRPGNAALAKPATATGFCAGR
jgi:transposase